MEFAGDNRPGTGRSVGRPAAYKGGSNRAIRLPEQVVEMISWIARVEGITAAQVVMPMIAKQLSDRYKRLEPEILRIKQAEDAATRKAASLATTTDCDGEVTGG